MWAKEGSTASAYRSGLLWAHELSPQCPATRETNMWYSLSGWSGSWMIERPHDELRASCKAALGVNLAGTMYQVDQVSPVHFAAHAQEPLMASHTPLRLQPSSVEHASTPRAGETFRRRLEANIPVVTPRVSSSMCQGFSFCIYLRFLERV